ncbi:MAG TPA: hypothetical protein VFH70_10600 [Acidimicrobiales bacterium]|nr:hypothetical protein [Acidimicrobiales bacterium]
MHPEVGDIDTGPGRPPGDGPASPAEPVAAPASSRSLGLWVAACIGLGLLSLLVPSTITYDPFTWAGWARQIVHWHLDTRTGPAWKPLPVLFDLPFAPLGRTALWAWLALARAGGFLLIVMAYRLARRYAGWGAGLFAATGVATSTSFAFYLMPVGLSEPLLAALALLAIERHLDGHHGHAVGLIYACVLLRPELLPFYLGYGVFLWRRSPRARVWLISGLVVLPLLLFLPDYIGSGDLLRSSKRAAIPTEGGPLLSGHPGLAVLQSAARAVTVPVLVGSAQAVLLSVRGVWRRREEVPLFVLCALAAGNLVLEALLTQLHKSAGDERYLIIGYSLMCVVAGIAAARLVVAVGTWRPRLGRLAATAVALFTVPFVYAEVQGWPGDTKGMTYQVHKDGQLQAVIAKLGRNRILGCGPVLADTYQGAAIAWYLDVPISRITIVAPPPEGKTVTPTADAITILPPAGTMFRTSNLGGKGSPVIPAAPPAGPFRVVAETGQWEVQSTCA